MSDFTPSTARDQRKLESLFARVLQLGLSFLGNDHVIEVEQKNAEVGPRTKHVVLQDPKVNPRDCSLEPRR